MVCSSRIGGEALRVNIAVSYFGPNGFSGIGEEGHLLLGCLDFFSHLLIL